MRFFFLTLSLTLTLAVVATAAPIPYPRPPPIVVATVVTTQNVGSDWNSTIAVTLLKSPDDARVGQIVYDVRLSDENPPPDTIDTSAGATIPGRAEWVALPRQTVTGSGNPIRYLMINSIDLSSSTEGTASCYLVLDMRTRGDRDQCGGNLTAPEGVSAIVTASGVSGAADIRWRVSVNDTDQDAGAFNYTVFLVKNEVQGYSLGVDPTTGADTGGVRLFHFVWDEAPFGARHSIMVEDPLTRLRSNLSCYVKYQSDALYDQSACGSLSAPGVSTGSASAPLVNIPGLASWMGVSPTVAALTLGGLAVFGAVLLGYRYGGGVGSVVGGVCGVGLAAFLNLIPLWLIILIFLSLAAAYVLSRRSSAGVSP